MKCRPGPDVIVREMPSFDHSNLYLVNIYSYLLLHVGQGETSSRLVYALRDNLQKLVGCRRRLDLYAFCFISEERYAKTQKYPHQIITLEALQFCQITIQVALFINFNTAHCVFAIILLQNSNLECNKTNIHRR